MVLNQNPFSTRDSEIQVHTIYVLHVYIHTSTYIWSLIVSIALICMHAVGLSVDWINNKLYYVDNQYSTVGDYVGVLDFLNNQFMKLITTDVGNLQDIIVDPTTK